MAASRELLPATDKRDLLSADGAARRFHADDAAVVDA